MPKKTDSENFLKRNSDISWIVFHRSGALGDFLLSMPLLKMLSGMGRPICLITRRSYLDVVPPACRIDRLVDVDSPAAGALFTDTGVPAPLDDILRAATVYEFCPRDARLETQFAKHRVSAVHWLDSRPTAPPHVTVQFFQASGLRPPHALLTTPLWERPRGGDQLWIHPGSGSKSKNAPLESLVERAAAWQRTNERDVWLSFGEADLQLKAPLESALCARQVQFRSLVLPSLGDLREALQSRAELFIGNDCGVTHLAALLGIPTTALFKTTDPRIWHPIGNCVIEDAQVGITAT